MALLLVAGAAGWACSGEPGDAGEERSEAQSALRSAVWEQLGANLNPFPGQFVGAPSLVVHPLARPALAFSTVDPATGLDRAFVLRWRQGDWTAVGDGLDGAGPSIAADDGGRLYACFAAAGKGPVVRRWDGDAWIALGGDLGIETGFAGTRYGVADCDGIQLGGGHRLVVAWSANIGAKNNAVYVAQWQRADRVWVGLGPGKIGGRATSASLATGGRDQLYVATFSPGGSYGGGATTRVWSWDGTTWTQLGADMPATADPVIAAGTCRRAHLALEDAASGAVTVMRWLDGDWSPLPSPGLGSTPALACTSSGQPVVTFVDAGAPRTIRVTALVRGEWREVGSGVANVGTGVVRLAIAFDEQDRPTLAWSEFSFAGSAGNVFAKRYSAALR